MQASNSIATGGCGTVYVFGAVIRNIKRKTVIHLIHKSASAFHCGRELKLVVVDLLPLTCLVHPRGRSTLDLLYRSNYSLGSLRTHLLARSAREVSSI